MEQFRTFASYTPNVGLSGEVEVAAPGEPGSYICVLGSGDDILLYVGIGETNQLVISRREAGEWTPASIPPLHVKGELRLALRPSGDKQLDVCLTNGMVVRVKTTNSLSTARALAGVGDWRTLEPAPRAAADSSDGQAGAVTDLDGLPVLGPLPSRELIYDIGMHSGSDTEYYLKKGFRVVAVEANPVLAAAAARRLNGWIRCGRLVIVNMGVAPEAGAFPFYVNKTISEWSSFDLEIASRGHEVQTILVNTVAPKDLFATFGAPYFAKVDVEGYDGVVVEAAARLPHPPKYVSFENGDIPIFEVLVRAGYCDFKLINQRTVPELSCPIPAAEGLTINHQFPFGSSGPFGEDTPGEWVAANEMRAFLHKHFEMRAQLEGPDTDWWDLHARRA